MSGIREYVKGEKSCEQCVFWKIGVRDAAWPPRAVVTYGSCRRFPPDTWTHQWDWCGEFKSAEASTPIDSFLHAITS
jgi:hypothetical protein